MITISARTPGHHSRTDPGCVLAWLGIRGDFYGGERGIRTLEGLLNLTPLAGVVLRLWLPTPILEMACFIGYFYTGFHRYL